MKNVCHLLTLALFAFVALILAAAVLIPGALTKRYALEFSPLPHGPRGQLGYVRGVRLVELEGFDNVVATGKATAKWEKIAKSTVDRVIFQLGGGALTKAMLTGIKLYVDETLIFDSTGSRTDSRMQYRGITANAAFLTLDFNEIRAKTIGGMHAGAIDMTALGASRITAEVDITGATTPTLTPYAMVSPSPQSNNAAYNGSIAKVLNKTFNFAAAGEFPLPLTYKRNKDSYLKRLHLFGSTVTALRVRKTYPDSVTDEIFKSADALNDYLQTEYQQVPQANIFHFDAIIDRDLGRALPLGDALQIEWFVTVSGAGNVTAESELLDPLTNN